MQGTNSRQGTLQVNSTFMSMEQIFCVTTAGALTV